MKKILYTVLAVVAISCSSDDNGLDEEIQERSSANFVVIGEDLDRVYQFGFTAETNSGEIFDLSQELGINPNYLTLREIDDFLSFYSFAGGAFSLAQKDIVTGETMNYDNFYANGPDRLVVWGTNNFTNVFFGYFTPGARNLAIQDVTLNGLTSIDITIDFSVDFLFQPLSYNDKIFITYRDQQGNYKLTFYDTLTQNVGPILNFNEVPISILIDEDGNLALVKNGQDATLEIYDTGNLSLIESRPFGFNSGFSPGPIEGAVLSNDIMYYARPFIQPSRFSSGPAVFDFAEQENLEIDLLGIAEEVDSELGASIVITVQAFSNTENVFLIGYGISANGVGGGVLQISPEGVLLENIELPFIPTYFVED